MAGRIKDYDDGLLVELIARGDMTYKAIADQVGISPRMVGYIARGRKRVELQPQIWAAVEENCNRARRLGARSLYSLVVKHVNDGLDPAADPAHARRCREFAITKFLNDSAAKPAIASAPSTPGLTSEDYEAIAKLKGGPDDDDDGKECD